MKTFSQYLLSEARKVDLEEHPISAMRPETKEGLDWEYEKEYKQYAPEFHRAKVFKSRKHFQQEYDKAPVRHLTADEHHNLDYSTHMSYAAKPGKSRLKEVKDDMGHRRDVTRIANDLQSGKTAPPIVIKHRNGIRILAGNTRMSVGAALGKSVPAKVIDVSDRY